MDPTQEAVGSEVLYEEPKRVPSFPSWTLQSSSAEAMTWYRAEKLERPASEGGACPTREDREL